MDLMDKLLDAVAKLPYAKGAVITFVALCVLGWLLFYLHPGQQPLSRGEFFGMALILLLTVGAGAAVLSWWKKPRSTVHKARKRRSGRSRR